MCSAPYIASREIRLGAARFRADHHHATRCREQGIHVAAVEEPARAQPVHRGKSSSTARATWRPTWICSPTRSRAAVTLEAMNMFCRAWASTYDAVFYILPEMTMAGYVRWIATRLAKFEITARRTAVGPAG